MQRIGISSACRYPMKLEESLDFLGRNGAETIEIFVNTLSEMEDDFVFQMKSICEKYSMRVVSVHPFSSFAETFCLFSAYDRRFDDFLRFYEKFFIMAKNLGAKYFIFHGAKVFSPTAPAHAVSPLDVDLSKNRRVGTITDEEYIRRFDKLRIVAKNCGITLLHENVVGHVGQDPDFLVVMRDIIGSEFKTVLDTKQAFRSGRTPDEYLDKLFDTVEHIHISDRQDKKDCVCPFTGNFDVGGFIESCENREYHGCYIQEVYSWSYDDPAELFVADKKLKDELKKCEK